MRKSKPIKIIVHMPENREEFEKIYIQATFDAILQIANQTPRKLPAQMNK